MSPNPSPPDSQTNATEEEDGGSPEVRAYKSAKTFNLVLIGLALLAVGATLQPLAAPLLMGAVLAGLFWPLRLRLTAWTKGRAALASGLILCAIVFIGLAVAFALGTFVFSEAGAASDFVLDTLRGDGLRSLLQSLPEGARVAVEDAIGFLPTSGDEIGEALSQALQSHGERAASATFKALSSAGQLAVSTCIMLIALFAFLLRGEQFLSWVDEVTPATREQLSELFDGCRKITSSVIISTLISSASQALAALGGYLISGVPHPLFFSFVTFILACVPAVGAASVCSLAALLLLVSGSPYSALFLFIWGVVVVGLADNVIKPFVMQGEAELDAAVVFFALIGGLFAFGGIGLITGPLFVSVLVTLLRIYRRDYLQRQRQLQP